MNISINRWFGYFNLLGGFLDDEFHKMPKLKFPIQKKPIFQLIAVQFISTKTVHIFDKRVVFVHALAAVRA